MILFITTTVKTSNPTRVHVCTWVSKFIWEIEKDSTHECIRNDQPKARQSQLK
jgi:hypothetical protein